MTVPSEMTAIVADATCADAVSRLRVARVAVPRPGPGEVLVKMHAAPCNPADLMYLQGRYGIDRPLPASPGFEGAGVIVASGGGMLARWLVGRRVGCGGHDCSGTWAEYCVAKAAACLPLAKALTFEQGAAALANPTTALALVDVMKRGGHRAFVQTAAAGQLGRMIHAEARARGFTGIHVVRRGEQAEAMRAAGAEDVLVSADAEFESQLAARAKALGATVALDAVAGDMTGRLLGALPDGGEVIIYGALSGAASGAIDPMDVAFHRKRVRGFEIAGYLKERGLWAAFRLASQAQKRVRSGVFTTEIADRVALADAPARLGAYVGRMSDGKILLVA